MVTIGQQKNVSYAYANAHTIIMQVQLSFLAFFNFLYLTHLGVTYCYP